MINNELWLAISDLYTLLQDKVNDEKSYQLFLEKYPIVFEALGYSGAQSFEKKASYRLPYDEELGYTPEPDFICANSRTGEVTIFELKTPFHSNPITSRSDGNRAKFKSSVETHIAQSMEYVESIRGRQDARRIVCEALNIDKISSYNVRILYGMSTDADMSKVTKLSKGRRSTSTEIYSFDNLLDDIFKYYSNSRPDLIGYKGLSAILPIALTKPQIHKKAYIFDMGQPNRDRISLYIKNNEIVLECIDSNRRKRTLTSAYKLTEIMIIMFSVSNDDGTLISLYINRNQMDINFGKQPFPMDNLDIKSLCIGGNIYGKLNACFQLTGHILLNNTISLKDRLGLQHRCEKTFHSGGMCVNLNGNGCLRMSAGDGDDKEI